MIENSTSLSLISTHDSKTASVYLTDAMLSSTSGDYEFTTSSSAYQRGSSLVRDSSPVGQTVVIEKRVIKRANEEEEEEEEEE